MVRWIDGVYGGLIAGVTSALFYMIVTVTWLHDTTAGGFFAQIAQALPGLHAAAPAAPLIALGIVLYFAGAFAFGLIYIAVARRTPSMWRAPTSVLWGLSYGLLVWWILNDVVVPEVGAAVDHPIWETLTGTIVFYGVVLSELTTLAYRRRAGASP
jgi:hypothetical protein